MIISRDPSSHATISDAFSLADLVSIIGYELAAYIGGATSTQSVVDWLQNGLPAEFEPRMRAAFDVAKPIAEVESEFSAQGFLIRHREETGLYGTPARMLREAGSEVARKLLMRVAASEFLSNEVANIEDIAARLQEWINHAELPEQVGYARQLWQNRWLSLTLIHIGFSEEVQRKLDRGIDSTRFPTGGLPRRLAGGAGNNEQVQRGFKRRN